MKKELQKTLHTTPKLWIMLMLESVIASLLYVILTVDCISKSTRLFITLGIEFGLSILGLLLFPKDLLLLRNEEKTFIPLFPVRNQALENPKSQSIKEDSSPDVKMDAGREWKVLRAALPQHVGLRFSLGRPKPVTASAMLNFAYWVVTYHPNVLDLQSLPERTLLRLIYEFEQSRPDLEPRSGDAWLEGIADLYRDVNRYKEAREVLMKR